MATETDRLFLLREAINHIRLGCIEKRDKDLADADLRCPPEYGGVLNPEVMRLRARAAAWRHVEIELDDILNDPIYRSALP